MNKIIIFLFFNTVVFADVVCHFDDNERQHKVKFSLEDVKELISLSKDMTATDEPNFLNFGGPVRIDFKLEGETYSYISYAGGFTALKMTVNEKKSVWLNFNFNDRKAMERFYKNKIIAFRFRYFASLLTENQKALIEQVEIPKLQETGERGSP